MWKQWHCVQMEFSDETEPNKDSVNRMDEKKVLDGKQAMTTNSCWERS